MKILLADYDRLQTHMIAGRLKAKGHKVIIPKAPRDSTLVTSGQIPTKGATNPRFAGQTDK